MACLKYFLRFDSVWSFHLHLGWAHKYQTVVQLNSAVCDCVKYLVYNYLQVQSNSKLCSKPYNALQCETFAHLMKHDKKSLRQKSLSSILNV